MTRIEKSAVRNPHPGLIISRHSFRSPFPTFWEVGFITLCIMDLLILYTYPSIGSYAKFTTIVNMKISRGDEIGFALGRAIPLTYDDGSLIPMGYVYSRILSMVQLNCDKYESGVVTGVTLRTFVEGKVENKTSLSLEDRVKYILESQNSASELKDEDIEPITPRVVGRRNRTYPKHFTSLKNSAKGIFLVADIETITLNSIKINHLVI